MTLDVILTLVNLRQKMTIDVNFTIIVLYFALSEKNWVLLKILLIFGIFESKIGFSYRLICKRASDGFEVIFFMRPVAPRRAPLRRVPRDRPIHGIIWYSIVWYGMVRKIFFSGGVRSELRGCSYLITWAVIKPLESSVRSFKLRKFKSKLFLLLLKIPEFNF